MRSLRSTLRTKPEPSRRGWFSGLESTSKRSLLEASIVRLMVTCVSVVVMVRVCPIWPGPTRGPGRPSAGRPARAGPAAARRARRRPGPVRRAVTGPAGRCTGRRPVPAATGHVTGVADLQPAARRAARGPRGRSRGSSELGRRRSRTRARHRRSTSAGTAPTRTRGSWASGAPRRATPPSRSHTPTSPASSSEATDQQRLLRACSRGRRPRPRRAGAPRPGPAGGWRGWAAGGRASGPARSARRGGRPRARRSRPRRARPPRRARAAAARRRASSGSPAPSPPRRRPERLLEPADPVEQAAVHASTAAMTHR